MFLVKPSSGKLKIKSCLINEVTHEIKLILIGGRRGHDCMVVGFTATCAIKNNT
jgi:hypothetical protein